jgi:GAF domain-containing protein
MARIAPALLAKSIGSLETLPTDGGLGPAMTQLVRAADLLFDSNGAGMMLVNLDGTLRSAGGSNPRATELEEAQEVTQTGPCVIAYLERRVIYAENVAEDERWPELWQPMIDANVHSVLSVPIAVGGQPMGTLNVFTSSKRQWDASDIAAVEAYAAVAGTVLASRTQAGLQAELASQLQHALDHRIIIEQAKGVLMGRAAVDAETAFEELRASARASRERVVDVARRVIAEATL